MAITYVAPQYDEKKYRQGIDTSFYNNAINNYKAQAEQQRATQIGEAQKTQQSALKQAYIQRAQNQQKLNENLARAGIRGGATESANLNLANQYGQARASANTDYARAKTNNFTICMEIQKTSNSQSYLEKEEWNWRNQPT